MLKKIPHTYVIVFCIIIFAAILTWIIPGGEFTRQTVKVSGIDREVVVNNSFHYTENQPQTWQIFSAFFTGFEKQAHIIIFILIIGGAFWIMNSTKAIDIGIMSFLKASKNLENWKIIKKIGINNIFIVIIMLIFSVFGAVFGMSEETIAFVIIFVPLAISMGYDSIVGVCMCYLGAHLGFAGALLNPFTIGIAQGISQIPLFSGIEYRFFCWIVISTIGIAFVLWYANKIKKNPKLSIMYNEDEYWRAKHLESSEEIKFKTPVSGWIAFILSSALLIYISYLYPLTKLSIGDKFTVLPILPITTGLYVITSFFSMRKSVHFFILNILMFTMLFLIIGVMGYGWYVMEIATLFLVMGLISGIAFGFGAGEIVKSFLEGARDIMSAALVVGLAGGIIVILNDGKIIDTILYGAAESLRDLGKVGSVSMIYLIETMLNIFIPSGTAKAALTMPIMSQFSDLIGISRQSAVTAFQFGGGFTNMITPTSGVLLGVLSMAKIPYGKWFKWMLPLMIILFFLGFVLLLPTVLMKLNGF
ncbi:MAG: YfcC family protein [Bacteroidia bacterium]|nr:YfcC family protein [Bacteroidia bacterium]